MWFTPIYLMFSVFTAHAAPQSLVKHLVSVGQHVECISVVCPAGSQLSFCKRNRTSDYCHQCPLGSSQPVHVDSKTVRNKEGIPKCLPIDMDCPPEAVPILENGKTIGCRCDALRGYAGRDYRFCRLYPKCSAGMAFDSQEGTCRPCPKGSYNPVPSYEQCTPQTNCTLHNRETVLVGNATMGTLCGHKLKPLVLTYPATTEYAILPMKEMSGLGASQVDAAQSDKNVGGEVLRDGWPVDNERHTNGIFISVVLVMGASIFLLIVMIVMLAAVTWRFLKQRKIPKEPHANVLSCEKLIDESNNDKPGIQAEDDCKPEVMPIATYSDGHRVVASTGKDYPDEDSPDWPGQEQPGTLTVYPQINTVPCTPTAPPETPSLIS